MSNIDTAFLVCAGLGTRMLPLTENCPKPLLPLLGKPILDHILNELRYTSVKNLVINTHYLPDHFVDYCKTVTGFNITLSHEPILLETGGGLVKALPHLGPKPIWMINGDAFWVNYQSSNKALKLMEEKFDSQKMDIFLGLTPITKMELTEGVGDYDFDGVSCVRRADKSGQFMFTGIRLLKPHIMAGYKEEKFSFLLNMDKAEQNKTLYGHVLDADWHHISTPEDLARVENFYRES